ncbi:MAG TPA: Ig-like domain-containing protein [Vicinamibacterales bacterium]
MIAIVAGTSLAGRGRAVVSAVEAGCPGDAEPDAAVIMCEDFEDGTVLSRWLIGSIRNTWAVPEFLLCGNGSGFQDRCAAWSNHLVFDGSWGFWGYDARSSFPAHDEFYVRWYQYISDPYTWGALEDKSVMLHDPTNSITAYVATSRNHQPVVPNSGPGVPFVANYQDFDWLETGGQYTSVNRFQNQGNDITLQPGKWYLFEWYVRLNTPGIADGVTKLWIDDATGPIASQTLRLHYTDMRWLRAIDAVTQFSVLRLTTYHQRCDGIPNSCPPHGPAILNQSHRWDRIVVSTEPIGPIRPSAVAVEAPLSGAIVSGVVPIAASVVADLDVVGVQFRVNGADLGGEDATAPFSVPWDTTAFPDGSYLLAAVARDAGGTRTTSRATSVIVANGVTTTRIEDVGSAITYTYAGTWIEGYADGRPWSGGTAALGFAADQRATVRFSGTGASWIGFRGPQTGIADVYLDDVLVATVDTYAATEMPEAVLYTASGLAPGLHTLTISVPNPRAKNESSTDYFIVVDAFDVTVAPATLGARIEETSAAIAYGGTWSHGNTARSWSSATAALATLSGTAAQAVLSFTGEGVRWVGFKGPQAGIAKVYLDGMLMKTVDTYAPTEQIGAVLFTASGLPWGAHTLTIESTGTRNPLSVDPFVVVDAFDVTPPDARADSTSPVITITWPPGGSIVAATTPVTAAAADNLAVAWVRFFVDGVPIATEDNTSPYSIAWHTTGIADGQHILTAVTRDTAGNVTLSPPVIVEVSNAVPPPPLPVTRFENTDRSIRYTSGVPGPGKPAAWFHGSRSRNWSAGTASFNRSTGARATFTFTGTGVSVIGFRAFWAGIAHVYLDEVFVAELDLSLPLCTAEQRAQGCRDEIDHAPVFTASALPAGSHTLTIEVTGGRNASAFDNAVVVDAFDVAPGSPPSATGLRSEETASHLSYSAGWAQGDTTRSWSGGTSATSAIAGARATVTLTGTEIRWIGSRGPQAGIARVFLDGAFHADVDLHSGADVQGVVFEATGLAAGRHELTVEATGARNPAAGGSFVVVDAFDARSRLEDTDRAVTYAGTWAQEDLDRAWSGTSRNTGSGTASRSATTGARAEFTFIGTEVRWIGLRGPSAGIADVSVDGTVVERVDLYAPAEEIQAPVFVATGLAEGVHTLAIEVTGLRNAAAAGASVAVDAFEVTLPSGAAPVSRFQQVDPRVAYLTSGWIQGSPNSLFSGRTAAVSAMPAARVEFTFTGSAIRWIGQRRRDGGIALVYLDGVQVAEIDTFGATQEEFQAPVFARTGLPPGTHALTIEVAGRKRGGDACTPSTGPSSLSPCSSGYSVIVDAFEVQ